MTKGQQDQFDGEHGRPQRKAKLDAKVKMAMYTNKVIEEEDAGNGNGNRGGRGNRVGRQNMQQQQQLQQLAQQQEQQYQKRQQEVRAQAAVQPPQQVSLNLLDNILNPQGQEKQAVGVEGQAGIVDIQVQRGQQQVLAAQCAKQDKRNQQALGGVKVGGVFQQENEDEDFKYPVPECVQVTYSPQYQVVKRLGKGGFGQVFLGRRIGKSVGHRGGREQGTEVALKMEHKSSKGCISGNPPQEWLIYQQIQNGGDSYGIPKMYFSGQCQDYYVMVLELLGPSLWDMWNEQHCRVSQDFAACFCVEAIQILRGLHKKGFVHGDIKPENFLMGPRGSVKEKRLYLVDFGLSVKWRQSLSQHVKYNQKPDDFRGTVRYASVHAHLGRTPSRRDDMESLAYTLIFLLKGRLPWQGYFGDNKSFLVAKKKMSTSAETLCLALKNQFKEFVDIAINLKFEEEPPYQQLMALFIEQIPSNIPEQPLEVCQYESIAVGSKRGRDAIENPTIDIQARKKIRSGCGGHRQWITVYNKQKPMKQRYHYNVGAQRLEHHIQRGYDEGLRISSVASYLDLWAVIMDQGTDYIKEQIYTLQSGLFMPKEWIISKWDQQYYITAVAGSDNGSSLIVMSQGTSYQQQSYKVQSTFPYEWIKRKWKEGYYITSMATSRQNWAVVMSRTTDFYQQIVELDFQYPSEGIHKRWDEGYRITACAATEDQAAFAMSKARRGASIPFFDETQETLRTTQFPAQHVKDKWDKELYISGICYGRVLA
eukprot:TRINITY_DN1139_c1_g1_i1.p1 TRINITY_DN1139_c1_g1~~TRINITY_DN1139_c1_g1_i1.p1  ORF type:complete len:762 (+),score=111.15 TRINITY_DN1139_c1_g1_i1:172-2457(+)